MQHHWELTGITEDKPYPLVNRCWKRYHSRAMCQGHRASDKAEHAHAWPSGNKPLLLSKPLPFHFPSQVNRHPKAPAQYPGCSNTLLHVSRCSEMLTQLALTKVLLPALPIRTFLPPYPQLDAERAVPTQETDTRPPTHTPVTRSDVRGRSSLTDAFESKK